MSRRFYICLVVFLTALTGRAQEYFTVVIFSDPHLALTGHDGTSVEQMQSYVRNICGMGRAGGRRIVFSVAPEYVPTADLVMCLGDMDGDSMDSHEEFESVMNGFNEAGIPFITMAGNHDYVPDYWTGTDGSEALTGGDSGGIADNEATKKTINHFTSTASNLGVEDLQVLKDGSNHRQPEVFTFRFRGVRFYCGQTYWFQKGYTVNKILSTWVTGLDKMYAPDGLINTLEAFVRDHASEPSIWTQHYPFLAGSDCDRWWLDQTDVGRYIKTDDWSEYGTNADLGKWTDDATARDYARKKKDRLASIINLTQNPIHFSGHTHRWAYNEYNGVRDYTVSSTGYSGTPGAAYVVLCQRGRGAVQVLPVQFNSTLPHTESQLVYLQQVATGQYLCAANDWGTQASLGDAPTPLMMEQLSDGTFTLETGISNGGDSHFLGWNELYCDQPAAGWRFEETGTDDTFLLTADGTSYLYGASKNKALSKNSASSVKSNTRAHWHRFTRRQLIDRFAEATPVNPVDATFLIGCPDFGRNDERYGVWSGGPVQGGNNANMCAERWNANFDICQELMDVPDGVYQLSCQGFYRAGGEGATATEQNALLYTRTGSSLYGDNEISTPLMNILSGGKRTSTSGYTKKAGSVYVPNSMTDASTVFTANAYRQNELLINVCDHRLRIGIRKQTLIDNDWTIFDRFRLTYLGSKEVYDGIHHNPQTPSLQEGNWYDLSGRRVSASSTLPKGVYIVNGKKRILP